jgi:monovalent cation:H+ antiporter-2, CPA2 family
VCVLVVLPVIAGAAGAAGAQAGDRPLPVALALTALKVGGFIAFMLVVGRRFVPWMLERVVHTRSRELFRLGVLATALGIAFGASVLFDVSFALGAFFAGMVLAESEFSQRAAEESLPLRDAFAVLFFVAAGMLFDPAIVVERPVALLATVLIIVAGKALAGVLIVRALRRPWRMALIIAAGLAQIGEFSFVLAALGTELSIISADARALIVAGAIISIMINPLLFRALHRWLRSRPMPVPPTDVTRDREAVSRAAARPSSPS